MNPWVQYLSVIAICLLCYGPTSNSRDSQFVFDDFVAIVRNSDVVNSKRPILETLRRIFSHDFWGLKITDPASHKSYRPLVTLMFHLEYRFYDEANVVVNMKLMNLFLHTIVCCMLLHLTKKVFHSVTIAWMASILFAIHPIHTEAVCGIVGRAELLCSVFYLSSLKIYVEILNEYEKKGRSNMGFTALMYFGFITSTILSLLCKEIGITVLPLCAIYDISKQTRVFQAIKMKKSEIFDLIPKHVIIRCIILILTTLFLTLSRLYIMNFESPTFRARENPIAAADLFFTRALTQNLLYVMNFWLLICPEWLCFDWSFGTIDLITNWLDYRIIGIFLLYTFLIAIAVRGTRDVYLALAFLIVPFIPASGIIAVGFVIAERILYLPSIGYCLLVCIGLNKFCARHPEWKTIFYRFFVVLCLIFVAKTKDRAYDWLDEGALFQSAVNICPNNAKVYYNIGRLYSYKNDDGMAIKFYEEAIRLYPDYDAALMNLGNIYRAQNKLDLAEEYIQRSIDITDDFPAAWMNLGIIKATRKQHEEALECYERALSYRKNYAVCYYNLGNLYLDMKMYVKAFESWKKSLAIDPKQSRPWSNILTLLDSEGKTDKVLDYSERALKILPNDSSIIFLRANAFGKLNRFREAEKLYRQALELQPEYALCYVNLGVLYHRWNKKSKAIESYRRALAINPNLSNAKKYLNTLLKNTNRHNGTIVH